MAEHGGAGESAVRASASVAQPLKVFISFAGEDDAHRETLVEHLQSLVDEGAVALWDDRELQGGDYWEPQIHSRLNTADIVLLLVSRSFMASDYCQGVEVPMALARNQAGAARVVPVILRACNWENAPFGTLATWPRDRQPLVSDDGKVFSDARGREVARELRRMVGKAPQWRRPPGPGDTPPWWRRRWAVRLAAVAGVVLVVALGLLVWRQQVEGRVRADLRLDRPDLAGQRLAKMPGAGLLLADLGEMVVLHLRGQQAVQDRSPDERALDALLRRHPDDAHLLFLRARRAYDRGDLQAMNADAQTAVTADPAHAAAHNLLGLAADAQGQSALAEGHYLAAMEHAPHEPQFAANRARAQLDQGRAAEAVQSFQRLDHYTRGLAEKALAHWALGQWALALESQDRVLRRMSQPPDGQAPEDRYNWDFFTAPPEAISLAGDDRRCYVAYGRAVTLALRDGGAVGAEQVPPECAGKPHLGDVREVIGADLCRYVIAWQPARAEVAQGLRRGWLGLAPECPVVAAVGPAT